MKYKILIALCFGEMVYGAGHREAVDHNERLMRRTKINNIIEGLPKSSSLMILEGHPRPVQNIKWCPDNIHIATYSEFAPDAANLVRVWNTQTGALIYGVGSGEEIKDFAWSPDGKKLAITHHVNDAWVCDLERIFEIEREMETLSSEQLSFMELFFAEEPLISMTKQQKKMFNKLPHQLKRSLKRKLEFNKEGTKPNPLRTIRPDSSEE